MTKTAMKKSNLTENLSLALVSSSSRSKSARHENAMQIVICKKKKKRSHDRSLRKQPTIHYVACTQTLLEFPAAVYIFITRARRTLRQNRGSVNRTIYDATTDFKAKLRLSNDFGNTILMTCHYLRDVGRAFDWLKQISLAARPIRSTTQV